MLTPCPYDPITGVGAILDYAVEADVPVEAKAGAEGAASTADTDTDTGTGTDAGTKSCLWPGIPVLHVVCTMQYARRRLGLIKCSCLLPVCCVCWPHTFLAWYPSRLISTHHAVCTDKAGLVSLSFT